MLGLLLTIAAAIGTAPAPTAPPRHRVMVFGDHREWFLFDPETGSAKLIPLPKEPVTGVAALPDGKQVYVTVAASASAPTRLLRFDPALPSEVKEVARGTGRFEEPSVTESGDWVYMTRLPEAGEEPLHHASRNFAQVVRVRSEGGQPEAVTSGDGCHFAPSATKGGSSAWVHSACVRPTTALEVMMGPRRTVTEVVNDRSVRDPSLSASGKRLVYAHLAHRTQLAITTIDLASKGRPTVQEATAPRVEKHPRPQIDLDDSTVYFESNHIIWKLAGNQTQRVLDLREAPP